MVRAVAFSGPGGLDQGHPAPPKDGTRATVVLSSRYQFGPGDQRSLLPMSLCSLSYSPVSLTQHLQRSREGQVGPGGQERWEVATRVTGRWLWEVRGRGRVASRDTSAGVGSGHRESQRWEDSAQDAFGPGGGRRGLEHCPYHPGTHCVAHTHRVLLAEHCFYPTPSCISGD